jgi:hypothetical protein
MKIFVTLKVNGNLYCLYVFSKNNFLTFLTAQMSVRIVSCFLKTQIMLLAIAHIKVIGGVRHYGFCFYILPFFLAFFALQYHACSGAVSAVAGENIVGYGVAAGAFAWVVNGRRRRRGGCFVGVARSATGEQHY